jgi:hypothetical protein
MKPETSSYDISGDGRFFLREEKGLVRRSPNVFLIQSGLRNPLGWGR